MNTADEPPSEIDAETAKFWPTEKRIDEICTAPADLYPTLHKLDTAKHGQKIERNQ